MSMKRKRKLLLILMTAMMLTACKKDTEEKIAVMELAESDADKDQTVTVERGDIRVSSSYDALVGPKVVQLSFPEDGVFGQYKVGLGDVVKEGDILAEAGLEQMDGEIQAKERELSNLKDNYEYQKASLEIQIENCDLELKKTSDSQEKAAIKEKKKRVKLQLEQLKEMYNLESTQCQSKLTEMRSRSSGNVIKAPFDGTIVALYDVAVNEGKTAGIDTNAYYVAIADTGTLYARCDYVSQSMINAVEKVMFWKDGKESEAVYIPMSEDVYREMNNNKETLYSEFELDNTDGTLESGDYGRIKLIVTEKKQVLLLPETAILKSGDETYVYRDNNGERERVSIKTGSKDGINVEITGGLEEGDVVYVQN